MADYFTEFSVVMQLPDQAAVDYIDKLLKRASEIAQEDKPLGACILTPENMDTQDDCNMHDHEAAACPEGFPEELWECIENWQIRYEMMSDSRGFQIWLRSDESGDVDTACAIMQHILKRYYPNDYATLSWSNTCSKPRTDGFGGGALFLTATEVKWMNTAKWACDQEAEYLIANPDSGAQDRA
jgi:hypothetical protein